MPNAAELLMQGLESGIDSNTPFNDEVCELLTEIISILYKTVNRMGKNSDNYVITKNVFSEDVLTDLQLLLGIRHNVLLRCVFECLLTLLEWADIAK